MASQSLVQSKLSHEGKKKQGPELMKWDVFSYSTCILWPEAFKDSGTIFVSNSKPAAASCHQANGSTSATPTA